MTGQVCNVSGFHESLGEMTDIPIGSATTAVDLPSGDTILIEAHEGLCFFDTMEHSLFPPAQVWENGISCDITPKHVTNGQSIFGLYDPVTELHIPFSLHGCIAHLPIREPSDEELDTCTRFEITSDIPWDPYSEKFSRKENRFGLAANDHEINEELVSPTYDFQGHRVVRATSSKEHRSGMRIIRGFKP